MAVLVTGKQHPPDDAGWEVLGGGGGVAFSCNPKFARVTRGTTRVYSRVRP